MMKVRVGEKGKIVLALGYYSYIYILTYTSNK